MSDEQATKQTPAPGAPVMDVVPPPQAAPAATFVEAPPEATEMLPISDEIAEQIAADSTAPPPPAPSMVETTDESSGTSAMAAPDAGDSPSDLIQSEINSEAAIPAYEAPAAPKVDNPARAAVIATVFITIALAGLAVFAYMSTQN